MNTLIIYDNGGTIFSQKTGGYLVPQGGVQYLEFQIPEGKRIKEGIGVDTTVTPHQVILEDIPKSETEVLKQQVADLQYELMMKGVL